jgi:hypothetical protein
MVPISRSMNGCDHGTQGTVLISVTPRMRRLSFLDQVLDDMALMLIHPARQSCDQEGKWIQGAA